MPAPGLRRPTYQGNDPGAEAFARGVTDGLKYLSTLPTTDGVDFHELDFGTSAKATAVYPLKHQLKRKARGITIINCRPRDQKSPSVPTGIPTHISSQDSETVAYVCLSADMANQFIWSFWVW